jgi:hypothetical protein
MNGSRIAEPCNCVNDFESLQRWSSGSGITVRLEWYTKGKLDKSDFPIPVECILKTETIVTILKWEVGVIEK